MGGAKIIHKENYAQIAASRQAIIAFRALYYGVDPYILVLKKLCGLDMAKEDLAALIALRKIALKMEDDLGVGHIPAHEREVILAAHDVASDDGLVRSEHIQTHGFVSNMSRATFFRALNALLDKGLLTRAGGRKRGAFKVMTGK